MISNYLTILEESLQKKILVLTKIKEKSDEQEQILKDPDFLMEQLDTNMEEKAVLVDELKTLDDGFESLFEQVKEELAIHKDEYAAQIRKLQESIKKITELSVSIQAKEVRNKTAIEQKFKEEREKLKQRHGTNKAAYDYYKNMNKINFVDAQFLDHKK